MSVPDRTAFDTDREPGPGPGGVRLCGYRHCRAPLPVVAGRGNRARYCPDGKTWGPQELSCKAAEAAYLAVASLHPDDPALSPAAVDALGERLAAAVEPLREVLDAVLTVRGQVATETRGALAERDAAQAEAADARGARQAAEDRATGAEDEAGAAAARALEAVERAAAAARARDRAAQDAAAATRGQLRADGRAAALAERLTRAEDLAAAAAQAGELRDQVAALTATLRARDTALEEERARSRGLVEDHRTELAARDAALAALRTEHQAELDRLRRDAADAQHQAAAEHAEIVDRLRAELAAAAERRATEHARQLAELHRQLGAADHQIEALRARLTTNPATTERG
jgi:chromosome segregation ATPase